MPRIKLDLREAEKRGAIPNSTYLCEIDEISAPEKGPKSVYVTATLVVCEGEHEGHKLYHIMPISGKGAGIFASFWEKATGDELDWDEGEFDVDTDDLVGLKVGVSTKQEEYPEDSGEFTSKVKRIYAAAAATGKGKKK